MGADFARYSRGNRSLGSAEEEDWQVSTIGTEFSQSGNSLEGNGSHSVDAASDHGVVGRVKWFNNQKGYGFIVYGDTPDVFVHHTAIRMEGYRTLKQGEEVKFSLVETNKGLQAVDVERVV